MPDISTEVHKILCISNIMHMAHFMQELVQWIWCDSVKNVVEWINVDLMLAYRLRHLKPPAWKIWDRGFKHHSVFQISNKQNVSSPLTHKGSILWGSCVTERYRARPQTTRARMLGWCWVSLASVADMYCSLLRLTTPNFLCGFRFVWSLTRWAPEEA